MQYFKNKGYQSVSVTYRLIESPVVEGISTVDIFWDGRVELLLTSPRIRGISTHGTGCTYSAAIAGYLALGCKLSLAVQLAKEHISQSIAQSVRIGKHTALNPHWR